MAKILLYGLSSFKNKGCEAIVHTTLNQFSVNDDVTIATFDYDNDHKFFKNRVKKYIRHYQNDESKFSEKEKKLHEYYKSIPFDYNNFETLYQKDVIKELKESDYALHIGGDNYCYNYNEWLYAINNTAEKYGKKTILWCASLFDKIDDPELIEDLNRYSLIIIREKASYNAVKKYIDESKLMLAPDPAFALEPKKISLDPWYQDNSNILGINLSPLVLKDEDKLVSVIEFINNTLNNTNLSILLIPHVTSKSSNDFDVLKKIKGKFKNNKRVFLEKDSYRSDEIKYIISKCKYFLTARTHASIAAYSTCVPTVVIGYSIKSIGIAEELFDSSQNYVIDSNQISCSLLSDSLNFLISNETSIQKKLSKVIPPIVALSKNTFKLAIEKINHNESQSVCDKRLCSGCMLCKNICPYNAIDTYIDDFGNSYPRINIDKCKKCGLCKKTCPVLNTTDLNKKAITCYAAKSNDEYVKKHSSSGGIFFHLANEILKSNGAVYGAYYSDKNLKHIRVDNISDLDKIMRSKYLQSDISNVYLNIKLDLDKNIPVLFCGTPCQVESVKKYLNGEYKNLYLVSIVCHGVTSNYTLNKRLKELESDYLVKVKDVNYRSKKIDWENYGVEYYHGKGSLFFKHTEDPLMRIYLNNYALRESCYDCKFKNPCNSSADIMLGDYWGVFNHHQSFFDKNGVSCVYILSSKGKELFGRLNKNITYIGTSRTAVEDNNKMVNSSSKKPKDNLFIKTLLKTNDLSTVDYIIEANKNNELLKEKKNEIDGLNNTIRSLDDRLNNLNNELDISRNNYNAVINSRRYKIINKAFKPIDVLKKRK